MRLNYRIGYGFICLLALIGGCGKAETKKTTLTLDWKPEPEFGGFYAAQSGGAFTHHGIDIDLKPAGEGSLWKLVASGNTDFATTSADQVLLARTQGGDVIAVFAVYQTCQLGIMTHGSRGFKSFKDVLSSEGKLLAEPLPYMDFLQKNFGPIKVTIMPDNPGIQVFLSDKNVSQQCFLTSEPILARQQHGDPQTFLVADSGFNPYTTVLICKGETWRKDPQKVKDMVAACREGGRAYLDKPDAANAQMGQLNKDMDAQTFTEAAEAQKPLIETEESKKNGLGTMTAERWSVLGKQLVDLKVIDNAPKAEDCFVNP